MPNHWATKVVFQKKPTPEMQGFLRSLPDSGGLCAALKPMPDCLKNTVSGGTHIKGKHLTSWYRDPKTGVERDFTPVEKRLLTKMGVRNWYDWCCNNWGTKWGTYHHRQMDGGSRTWRCDSAWGPPRDDIWTALFDRFKIPFVVYGHDEGETAWDEVFNTKELV